MSCAGATYRINQEEELERRRLAAAQAWYERSLALLRRLETRIARMQQVYGDVEVDVPVAAAVLAGARADDYEAAASANAAAIDDAYRKHEAAIAKARARQTVTPTFALPQEELAPAARPVRFRPAQEQKGTAAPRPVAPTHHSSGPPEEERRGKVERQMARLPGAADAEEVRRAEAVATEALTAGDDVSFRRAVDRLRMTVATSVERHRAIDARTREIEALRAGLDGLVGSDVDSVRQRLDATDPRAALPTDLAHDGEAAAARASGEQDRSFALAAVAGALKDLGYDVGEDFDEAASDNGAVVALPSKRSDDHALRVEAGKADLHFEVVRYGDASESRERDRAVEETWREDQRRLVDGLADRGVDLVFGTPEEPHDLDKVERGRRRVRRDGKRKNRTRARARQGGRTR